MTTTDKDTALAVGQSVYTLQKSMGVLCDALRKIAAKEGDAVAIAKAALNYKDARKASHDQ